MDEYVMGQAVDVLVIRSGWTPGIYRGTDGDGLHRVLMSLNGPIVLGGVHGQHLRHRDDHDRVRSMMIDQMIAED